MHSRVYIYTIKEEKINIYNIYTDNDIINFGIIESRYQPYQSSMIVICFT